MTVEAIEGDLRDIVGARWVSSRQTDRLAYNNDCWPRGIILTRGHRVDQYLPTAIVQPGNEKEIVAIIAWARKTGTPIVPFGAGSGVCGGATADGGSVVVDLKRFRNILDVRDADMTARAESGVLGIHLERELNRRGFTLGHFPSSLYCSSLGGYLAARSAGQNSSLFGKMEDMVISARVITGSGEILDTAPDPYSPGGSHNAADHDLTQVFVGSEGTLGLITRASLRIHPLPTHRHFRGFRLSDVPSALEAIRTVMQTGLRPSVVRLYDAFDSLISKRKAGRSSDKVGLTGKLVEFARQVLPSEVSDQFDQRIHTVSKALLKRVLAEPLSLNTMVEALPSECMMVIGFEGWDPKLVEAEAEAAFDLIGRYGIDLGRGPGEHWISHRFDVSYKQSALYHAGVFVDTMEVSTTWSNLARLYEDVRRAMSPHVFVMAHFSHVYPEGSSIYFTFAGFGRDVDDTLARYEATWKAGLDAASKAGGNVAHHHGVGRSKAFWTSSDHPGGKALFNVAKKAFDPDRILNPGKVYLEDLR
jgi:alkyldihydroxyacetonephosphate synthase